MAKRTLSAKGFDGKRRTLKGAKSFAIDFDSSGLSELLSGLEDGAQDAVRPAAQAAAQVIYERIRLNVSGLGRVTGNLERSIYQAFSSENSQDGKRAQYNVSWNHKKAPHGHLVEYGYLQRYRYRPDGMGPMVRPGMDGRPKPSRNASQSAKDAYYVTLDAPKQVPGKAFVRSADAALEEAYKAAQTVILQKLFDLGSYYGA